MRSRLATSLLKRELPSRDGDSGMSRQGKGETKGFGSFRLVPEPDADEQQRQTKIRLSSRAAMRTGTLAGAMLAAFGAMQVVRALPIKVSVAIDCGELSAEAHAHVEAMVRADLQVRAAEVTHVSLVCHATWVTSELHFRNGSMASRGEPKASLLTHLEEQLILLSDDLLLEKRASAHSPVFQQAGSAGPPWPSSGIAVPSNTPNANSSNEPNSPSAPKPTDLTSSSKAVRSNAVTASNPSNTIGTSNPSNVPRSRKPTKAASSTSVTGVQDLPKPATLSQNEHSLVASRVRGAMTAAADARLTIPGSEIGSGIRTEAEHQAVAMRLRISGGVQFDPVLRHTSGMLGPNLTAAIELNEHLAVGLIASIHWVLAAPSEFGVRDHRLGVAFEYGGKSHLSIGFNALLTALRVSTPDTISEGQPWSAIEPASQFNFGYRFWSNRFAFEIKPNFTLYAHSRVIRLDLKQVLEMPAILAGIQVQTTSPL